MAYNMGIVLPCDKTLWTFENTREMQKTRAAKIQSLRMKNNKTRFFHVLCSEKTWIFDQSERTLGPIYILIRYKGNCST